MKEKATVIKTTGKIATVQIIKSPQCESCKACAFKNGKSTVKVKAKNDLEAKSGDEVYIACEKDNRTLASFLVYIVPVIFLGIGAIIGYFCFKKELYTVLLCLGLLVLGFLFVFTADKLLSKSKGFGMEIIEIINNDITPEEAQENKEDNLNG